MCEQCMAETVDVVTGLNHEGAAIMPGFYFQRATKDGFMMKAGQYCLVECNDPSFIFDAPEKEPDEKNMDEWMKWAEKAKRFEDQLRLLEVDFKSIYKLVKACYESGYKDDDGRFAFWLFNFLAQRMP